MADDDETTTDADLAELQDEALRLRQRLERGVDGLKAKANRLTDWRYYARTYPMAVMGLGLLTGYLLMPRRTRRPQYPPPLVVTQPMVNGSTTTPRPRWEQVPSPRSPIRIAAESLLQSALAFTAQRVMEGQWGARQRVTSAREREELR